MATLAQIKKRLVEYLELEDSDPQLIRVLSSFSLERERRLQVFPFLAIMYGICESERAELSATVLEAVLFDIWWIDRSIADRDCVPTCRGKLETILSLLADESYKYVHDPNLAIWSVVRALMVEHTARNSALKRVLRSREGEMLERAIADCQAHLRDSRPLPIDLATRLRALESQGIVFPSDLYSVLGRQPPK